MIKRILGVVAICYFLASCKPLNPSIMFRTDKNYEYDEMQADTTLEYIIAPNDVISFRLFTNNGFKNATRDPYQPLSATQAKCWIWIKSIVAFKTIFAHMVISMPSSLPCARISSFWAQWASFTSFM